MYLNVVTAFVANSLPSVKLDEFEAALHVCYLIIMTSRAPETPWCDFYLQYLNFSTRVALVYGLEGPITHARTYSIRTEGKRFYSAEQRNSLCIAYNRLSRGCARADKYKIPIFALFHLLTIL